jgi:hypothetical protein
MGHKAAFSLKKALIEAVGFLPTAWSGAWLVLLMLLTVGLLVPFLIWHAAFGIWLPWMNVVANALGLVVKLMALGALYRLAIFRKAARVEGLGLGGVQFGAPEVRILAALIIMMIFLIAIAATFILIFIIAFNLSPLGDGYRDTVSGVVAIFSRATGLDWLFIVYAVLAILALFLLTARLSLMFAATIAERRLVTLNALALGEGNGLKLMVGVLLLLLPYPLSVLIGLKIPQDDGDAIFLNYGLYVGVTAFVILPLSVGFFASAYRQMRLGQAK